ncbi:hypothetical protein JZ751_014002 [Albula glossodonta]|uniref:Uncharacterized protein n=1 Tax=Albula glossodonta TaxID=121402 RepID=A0A8T2MZ00_9TELE|nr:hypothetical protein JZ751_014002 [Albula glossodonta]
MELFVGETAALASPRNRKDSALSEAVSGHTVITVVEHKTAATQVASFALSQEEEATLHSESWVKAWILKQGWKGNRPDCGKVLGRRKPAGEVGTTGDNTYVKKKSRPPACDELLSLMQRCWHSSPDARASFQGEQ